MTEQTNNVEENENKQQVPTQDTGSPWVTPKGTNALLPFFGFNGSTIYDVTTYSGEASNSSVSTPQVNRYLDWENRVAIAKLGQKRELLAEGVAYLDNITAETNLSISFLLMTHAERAYIIGRICNCLQVLTKGLKIQWRPWAKTNIPFLGQRNRERYMMIAEREDAYPYTLLGIDRLEHLCVATKGMIGKVKDPIGALFKSYKIAFNPEAETNLEVFKNQVDAAIICQRLKEKGLKADFDKVCSLITLGVEFNNTLIKDLVNIKSCGGNPIVYMETLGANGGKDPADTVEAKRPEAFNKISHRLIETIDYLIEGIAKAVCSASDLDKGSFEKLLEKLNDLNEVINPVIDNKEE